MSWTPVIRVSTLAAALIGVIGCGGPSPVKVSGKVTLNGQAVEGISVQFVPVASDGKNAIGSTKADGSFDLTTIENKDGALPGDYKVVLTYVPPVETGASDSTSVMKQVIDTQKQAKKKPKHVIPSEYTSVTTTKLTQKVPTDGPVNIDIK